MSAELTNRRLIVDTPNAAGAVGPYSQVRYVKYEIKTKHNSSSRY